MFKILSNTFDRIAKFSVESTFDARQFILLRHLRMLLPFGDAFPLHFCVPSFKIFCRHSMPNSHWIPISIISISIFLLKLYFLLNIQHNAINYLCEIRYIFDMHCFLFKIHYINIILLLFLLLLLIYEAQYILEISVHLFIFALIKLKRNFAL